jgi:dipeptidyl aminopeptidase/acylaminoacyl peptidase
MKSRLLLSAALLVGIGATLATDGLAQSAPASRDIIVNGRSLAAGVGRVPTAGFGRRPFMSAPRLSPDGTKLVVRMSNLGRDYLSLIDLATPGARPQQIMAANEYRDAGDRTMGAYRWVGNHTVVITVASREIIFGGRNDLTRLVAYDTGTRRLTQLAWEEAGGAAANVLHINHETGHILVQRTAFRDGRFTRPEVVDVDVATGRFRIVQQANTVVSGWFADANGVVRMGTGYDGDSGRRRLMYRSNASGTFRTISNESDPTFTDAGVQPEWIDANSDNAIIRDNRSGFSRVYRMNLATGTLGEQVFAAAEGYDADGVETNWANDRVIGYSAIEQRARMEYTDPVYRGIQQVLDESFGAGNARILDTDRSERKLVVYVAKPNQAGAYYLFNSETGAFGLIGNRSNAVGATELNPVSAFRYTASDGVSIEAIMTMPRHRTQTRGLPLVILTHGGPFGPRDDVSFDPWAQAMAELGYVVVQPNYRGSGGYGREFVTMGRNNGFGLRMQDDLNDVITHLSGTGLVDPARVCMMGWSYGGYASARAAQRDPDRYRCTVAGAGVYDLAAMREYDVDYLGSFGSDYLSRGAAQLSTVSPTRNAEGRWAPILIVHGVRDQRVPVSQGRGLVAALRRSGKTQGTDYDYIEQPQNTHNLDYEDVAIEWLQGAERWMTRWNPAYIPSDTDRPVPLVEAAAGGPINRRTN